MAHRGFDHSWFCWLTVWQVIVQPTATVGRYGWLAAKSSPLVCSFSFFSIHGISHQIEEGRRNETGIHPFLSKFVTLRIWVGKWKKKTTKIESFDGNKGHTAPYFP